VVIGKKIVYPTAYDLSKGGDKYENIVPHDMTIS